VRNAVKIRLYPTPEQVAFLDRQFGDVRLVWNKVLAVRQNRYKRHGKKITAKHDLKPLLAVAKNSRKYGWLSDFYSMALQQSCINLDRAFVNFFQKRAGHPGFKRKHGNRSLP
jgi:putative transposase